jgi:hypothetical protein
MWMKMNGILNELMSLLTSIIKYIYLYILLMRNEEGD